MQTTSNLGLKKPDSTDVVDIADLNGNADALDGKFGSSSGHGHTGAAGDGPKIGSSGLAAGAATDTVIGSRTVSDSTAPTSDSGTPTTLFGWLGNMIKAITGGATWRTLPGMTIAAIKTILDGATNAGTASTLMKRDASGRAQVAAPSAAADIARKDTVDAVQSNLNTHAAVGSTAHGATSAPTVSTLMSRDSAGRAQVVAPSVAADIANKGYVDTAVSGATIPDASLTVKGKVQLSSATNSTSEVLAATPKAVKDAYDRGSAGVTAAAAAQTRANGALLKDGSEAMNAPLVIDFPHGLKARHVDGVSGPGVPGDLFLNYNNPNAAVYIGNYNTAWHSGNDGAGSGLDADMLDGAQLSDIYYRLLTEPDANLTCKTIGGQNLNGVLKSGFYMGSSMVNAPNGSAEWFYVQVMRHNDMYTYQRATQLTQSPPITYERIQNASVWGEWLPVGGATYVASNNVREGDSTERSYISVGDGSENYITGMLMYKFVPRFSGEIVINVDLFSSSPSYTAAVLLLSHFRDSGSSESSASSNTSIDYRIPVGTAVGGFMGTYPPSPSNGMKSIATVNGLYNNWVTRSLSVNIYEGLPLYIFLIAPGSAGRVRNIQVCYDIK